MRLLVDLTPLRESVPYRHLWIGQLASAVGAQLATTAIALQLYAQTGSSMSVGLVGLFALVPIVVVGLYGGAVVDVFDRRKVALAGGVLLWVTGALNVTQAALGNTHPWVLYALVALHSTGFAIVSPARSSIYPRLLPPEQLPAANALNAIVMSGSMFVGPLLAGFMVEHVGYTATYLGDALLYTVAMWGMWTLPPVPPQGSVAGVRARMPGLRSVADGVRFLATAPNIRMTFLTDFCAMVLANPRALLPAVAIVWLGGTEGTTGVLSAAIAAGALLALTFSGPVGRVRRQGVGTVAAVGAYGVAVGLAGVAVLVGGQLGTTWALVLVCAALALSGSADSMAMVFRTTILQVATPDHLRGRLQGIFIVVVAGGPRLGEFLLGSLATVTGEGWALVGAGVACVVALTVLVSVQRRFLDYDAADPRP
ncbi:MFS transporter [Georgenia sp. Z1344]|uniref:MFS transporter n=1 Tax=Georgenia sp. Z1344 TaxID=3416706 RepID=UPI003CEC35EB